jgi:PAS domain S-box-containing protein
MPRFSDQPIRTKFYILMSLLLLVLFLASAFFTYHRQKAFVLRFAVDNARNFARQLIETRDYMSSVVKNEPEQNYNLVPQVVATNVAKRVTQNTKYYVRQVSLRYRNPQNSPDPYEQVQLHKFANATPPAEVHSIVKKGSTRYFRYMQPMIATTSCLECHGSYETAPRFVQLRFPPGHYSYNYRVGEVIGAVSVTIPMEDLYKGLGVNLEVDLATRGTVFLIVILIMGTILRRQVIDPVKLLSEEIVHVTKTGDFETKLPQHAADEIGQVFSAFNELMDELAQRTLQTREADERYRLFIELANSAVVTFLPDGKIVIVNQKAEALFGKSRQELLGESIFSFIEDEATFRRMLATGVSSRESVKLRVRDTHGKLTEMEAAVSASRSDRQPMFTTIIRESNGK